MKSSVYRGLIVILIAFISLLAVSCPQTNVTDPTTYTVTYDDNVSDDGTAPVDSTHYLQGQAVTVLGNPGGLVRGGYAFSGWNTQADGSGTTYTQGDTFTMGANNVTLFALWTSLFTYTVTYDDNGSGGGTVPVDPTSYLPGETVTVLGNSGALVRNGYIFSGWNTQDDGNGTTYTQGDTFTMGASNLTLYARWLAIFVLTVNAGTGGGTTPSGDVAATQGVPTAISATADSGYTFSRWTVVSGSGVTFGDANAAVTTVTLSSGPAVIAAEFFFVWTERTAPGALDWRAVTSSADGTKLAACNRGSVITMGNIWWSTDGGLNWQMVTALSPKLWMSLASSADGDRLAGCVDMGDIYAYESGAWHDKYPSSGQFWLSIASSGDGETLAAGVDYGGLGVTIDGGDNWTVQSLSSSVWKAIAISADGNIIAACPDGKNIQTAVKNGTSWTWTERTASGKLSWKGVAASSDGQIIAACADLDYIKISANGGATWSNCLAAGVRSWRGIALSADGSKIAACVSGGDIWTSADGGATWVDRSPAGSRNWCAIASSADGRKLTACDYNGSIWTGQ